MKRSELIQNELVFLQEGPIVLNRKKKQGSRSCRDFNCDFEFVETDHPSRDEDWAMADVMSQLKKKVADVAEQRTGTFSVLYADACSLSVENHDDSGPENRENPKEEESWGESRLKTIALLFLSLTV